MKLLFILILLLPSLSFAESKCIAHRGDREQFAENSMAAFISAYQRGADGTELDIHHTKDHYPLIMHDQTLQRTAKSRPGGKCRLTKKINKLKLIEIQKNCILKDGQDIPTLGDLFSYFSDKQFFLLIEFKNYPSKKSLNLIKKYYNNNNSDFIRLMSISFFDSIFRIRNLKMFSSFWRSVKFFPTTGKYKFFSAISFDGVDVDQINSSQIESLHRKDKEVSVWTKNSLNEIKRFRDLNADFITTDLLSNCLQVRDMF